MNRNSPNQSRPRVAVIQQYIPAYRTDFFERVRRRLNQDSIDLTVVFGKPEPTLRRRNDASDLSSSLSTKSTAFRTPWGPVSLRFIPPWVFLSDLVVIEQSAGNLESYALIFVRKLLRLPTASWGHGQTITKAQGKIAAFLQRKLLRSSDFFFAYTEGSASKAEKLGFPRERTFIMNNSHPIANAVGDQRIPRVDIPAPLQNLDIADRWVALFIGGLDASKNLQLMWDAAEYVWEADPRFLLIVAGEGVITPPKSRAIIHIGRISDSEKIAISRHCKILLNPGRIGLIAVDALALNLPIVTTEWSHHGPEADYLDADTLLQAKNEAGALAELVSRLMSNPSSLDMIRGNIEKVDMTKHFEMFIDNYCDAIIFALHSWMSQDSTPVA